MRRGSHSVAGSEWNYWSSSVEDVATMSSWSCRDEEAEQDEEVATWNGG